ncbi:14518_t:CDS:2, partial [Racocetra fulgida]
MSLSFDKEKQTNDNNKDILGQNINYCESDNDVFSTLLDLFKTIGGRRFLNESKQALPSDATEFERKPDLEYKNLGNSMKLVQDAEDGFEPKIALRIFECFESINGVGNVERSEVSSPIGNWSGSFGELTLEQIKQFYGALTYMPDYMKISPEEYQQLFDDFDKE